LTYEVKESAMSSLDKHELFWVREEFYENSHNWKENKFIVFGHTPKYYMGVEGSGIFRSGNLVGIDTLCYKTGVLTGFDTETEEIYQTT
jgi:diadenosine tetraphosphatase ApaH/serine/threonine PP2A family protein phosphatase